MLTHNTPWPTQDEYRDAPGSVVASDFYHANDLMPLSDEEIVRRVHSNVAACEPGFADAKVSASMTQMPPAHHAAVAVLQHDLSRLLFLALNMSHMFFLLKGCPC